MRIRYFLSSEQWGPGALVRLAAKAKTAGFEDLWISDAFFEAWREQILPRMQRTAVAAS